MFLFIAGFILTSINPFIVPTPIPVREQPHILARHEISLEKRYNNPFVNKVFKDNMLLTLAYMDSRIANQGIFSWNEIEKPSEYTFTLNPNTTFAFHNDVLHQFESTLAKTTNAHFNEQEGFLYDGDLYGDGVCHLASLMYWTAKDAKLDALAPTPHDFAVIPEIPKEYGVAVFDEKDQAASSQAQNLYITNNRTIPVTFTFDYSEKGTLGITISTD